MSDPIFQKPVEVYANDAGYAGTSVPPLPYYVFDGGTAAGVSNPSFDGGSAFNTPFMIDGGGS
jgi:hypothetical protein